VGPSRAELPARPALEGYAPQVRATGHGGLARIDLLSGKVDIYTPQTKAVGAAKVGTALAHGELIATGTDAESRVRVVLGVGDVMHLGPGTLLGMDGQAGAPVIRLWHGQLTAYAMPLLEGRGQGLAIETPAGVLELRPGKVGVSAGTDGTEIAVFHDGASWTGSAVERRLYAGDLAKAHQSDLDLAVIPDKMEGEFSAQVSPEVPAVERGLALFRAKDREGAREAFALVQAAFPYNGPAAYYLGLFHLDRGELGAAIRQWQRYSKIDPEGAKEKGVPRQLTVLVTQRIKEEVQYAVANEKRLSTRPPEPNSIAIHPLNNKGSEKYRAIGKGLTAMVISDVAKVPGLKVLERQKIQQLLDEIKLSESGLVSEDTALRSGKLLRADKIVVGDYKVRIKDGTIAP
jgi:tetratricopeptide (TPR) repeat protein